MYNKAVLIGRICSPIQTKTIDSGKLVGNFRMETNDNVKQFHAVNCYEKTADYASRLKEGDIAFIEGRVVTRSYRDKNGEKKYITSINAARLHKVEESEGGDESQQESDDF